MRHGIIKVFLLVLVIISSGTMVNAFADSGEKFIVAVTDFSGEGLTPAQLEALRSNFEYELVKTGIYTVLERTRIDEILEEQAYQLSGTVDDAYIIQVGKQLGAQYIFTGNVIVTNTKIQLFVKMLDVKLGLIHSTDRIEGANYDELLSKVGESAIRLATTTPGTDFGKPNPVAWTTLGVGAACIGVGGYFFAVSLPLIFDFYDARAAYDAATSDFDSYYIAVESARTAAVEGNANTNFMLAASLTGAGLVLTGLSIWFFIDNPLPLDAPSVAFWSTGLSFGFSVSW